MNYFATYFDKNYLPKALLLFESLIKHSDEFTLFVLCLDDETFDFLKKYDERIRPTLLSVWELTYPELVEAKNNRSLIEYYFTLTSVWSHHLISSEKQIEILSYLDADLYFFSNPSVIFDELGDHSVLIIPHNFSQSNKSLNVYGKYNVGFICWKNDKAGLSCLSDWRAKCLDWCFDRLEEDKFADQKYLDSWPSNPNFRAIVSSNHGLNAAYYNIGYQNVSLNRGQIHINNNSLVFYHFHKVKQYNKYHFNINLLDEQGYKNSIIIKKIYGHYLNQHRKIERQLRIKSDSIRYEELNHRTSIKKIIKSLFFGHNIVATPIFVLYIRLENQFMLLFRFYRSLKGLRIKS